MSAGKVLLTTALVGAGVGAIIWVVPPLRQRAQDAVKTFQDAFAARQEEIIDALGPSDADIERSRAQRAQKKHRASVNTAPDPADEDDLELF